ncbi:MAG: Trk system potassium transporter TrkA [Bacteroidales bacterium]|nr:Trk system potassium transporter TrkA [Bacteroidales bacterium]
MKIVIAGAGQVGSHLAKMLSVDSHNVTVIDPDHQRLSELLETTDVVSVEGSTNSVENLRKAGVPKADLFVAVNPSSDQNVNLVSAMLAKSLGCKRVTARVNYEEYTTPQNRELFANMGIDHIFYPEKLAATEIIDLLKRTGSTDNLDFAKGKLQMCVFKIEEDSPLLDRSLIDFSREFPGLFRVAAVNRRGETLMPYPEMIFKYNDLVYIIATKEGIEEVKHYLGAVDIHVRKVMIMGGGLVGEMLARQLSTSGYLVKILEKDKKRCYELSESLGNGVVVVNIDGTSTDDLLEENIKEYDAFVSVTGSSEANILACVTAKKLGVTRTIAQVENLEYIRLGEEMGVDATINKKLLMASRIFKLTLSNKVKFVRYMSGTDAEVIEYVVAPGARITKGALKDISFPANAVIGGYIRGAEAFIAVGDTVIQPDDHVIVFAGPDAVKDIEKFFK